MWMCSLSPKTALDVYYDYAKERVSFIQTFFPDQIKNYSVR